MASVNKVTCPTCGGCFDRTTKQLNSVLKRSGKWSCSPCVTSARNKENAKPIGAIRKHKKTGYIEEKTENGWRRQHIIVMERFIGRPINEGEVVHHNNEIKDDNRLSNLRLMTNGEHTALHHIGQKRTPEQKKKIAQGIRLSSRAVLTDATAKSIFERKRNGETQVSIARSLGVSPMTVSRVVNNQTWR